MSDISSIESVNEIYQTRVDALEAADEKDREAAEQAEADSDLESVDTPLQPEQEFGHSADEEPEVEPTKATTTKKAAAKK